MDFQQVLVFLSTCDGVEFHHRALNDAFRAATGAPLLGCPIFKLHGNLAQARALGTPASIGLRRLVSQDPLAHHAAGDCAQIILCRSLVHLSCSMTPPSTQTVTFSA